MTLVLSNEYSILEKKNEVSWCQVGVTDIDYELAEEVGLLDPSHILIYEEMIDYEEELIEDYYKFILDNDTYGLFRNCEFLDPQKTQENIDVRILIVCENFAIGAIEGRPEVYIPIDVLGLHTLGEICLMDIIYNLKGKNVWKALYIHTKEDPFLLSEYTRKDDLKMSIYLVPKQNIGKMIGKNGKYIHLIKKDFLHNNPDMVGCWDGPDDDYYKEHGWKADYKEKIIPFKNFPQIDVINKNGLTQISVWEKLEGVEKRDKRWNTL